MMLQLNPPIPVVCDLGDGYAYFLKDESIDHHCVWGVVLDNGGEIWWIENPKIRVAKNWTYGRVIAPSPQPAPKPTPSLNSRPYGKSRGEY